MESVFVQISLGGDSRVALARLHGRRCDSTSDPFRSAYLFRRWLDLFILIFVFHFATAVMLN